jgi:hypothetical protein
MPELESMISAPECRYQQAGFHTHFAADDHRGFLKNQTGDGAPSAWHQTSSSFSRLSIRAARCLRLHVNLA